MPIMGGRGRGTGTLACDHRVKFIRLRHRQECLYHLATRQSTRL